MAIWLIPVEEQTAVWFELCSAEIISFVCNFHNRPTLPHHEGCDTSALASTTLTFEQSPDFMEGVVGQRQTSFPINNSQKLQPIVVGTELNKWMSGAFLALI